MLPGPPLQRLPSAAWVNTTLYPFQTAAFVQPMGTMRYVDEGVGDPIVMVHGNPVWSLVYRKLIMGLSDRYRCIAPDHLGFGQSDKPPDWTYLPQDHAANLTRLLDALQLEHIMLVVQDWGGPIGLSYAIDHPDKVARLVILNTWCWSVQHDWYYLAFSGIMGGMLGRFLCREFNGVVRGVVPIAYGEKAKLTPAMQQQYLAALPTPTSRKGTWVFPKQIIAASDWLAERWSHRERLATKPTMIAWGMKDIAFRARELDTWRAAFPQAQVTRFPQAGHYVQDEEGEAIAALMRDFLGQPE
jgi:haloalkane dehalogenase